MYTSQALKNWKNRPRIPFPKIVLILQLLLCLRRYWGDYFNKPGSSFQGSRVLLFSQFTMMLDIIEIYMNERGHKFLRLDGSTPVAER